MLREIRARLRAILGRISSGSRGARVRLAPPPRGKVYHGVFPGDYNEDGSGEEKNVTNTTLKNYLDAVGRTRVAWVYFSNEWKEPANRRFPREHAKWVSKAHSVPFIRLMLRTTETCEEEGCDKNFSFERILGGAYDEEVTAWGKDAARYGKPLLVEWGTECNGESFWWNAKFNPKVNAPEKFKQTYRHIVDRVRHAGADNISWVFHIDAEDSDKANPFQNFYPGSDYVDWVAVSKYGAQKPKPGDVVAFEDGLEKCRERILKMAPGKPIVIAEFGCAKNNAADPGRWAGDALRVLLNKKPEFVDGFSWWNGAWQDNGDKVEMRVQCIPEVRKAFQDEFKAYENALQEKPIFTARSR